MTVEITVTSEEQAELARERASLIRQLGAGDDAWTRNMPLGSKILDAVRVA